MSTAQMPVENTQSPMGSDSLENVRPSVQDVIKLINNSDISSIKSVLGGIIDVINNPESSAKDLTDLVETDPPLVARVLKTANSAYYSPVKRVSEILQAVIMIGFDTLKEIVLSQKVGELFQGDRTIEGFSRSLLWKNSVGTAIFGKMLFRREFGERGDQMYTAGLLHNVGIIVEHQFFETDFSEVMINASKEQKNVVDAEKEIFGFSHTDLGNAIAVDWGFPDMLIQAIGFHHGPDQGDPEMARYPMALYVADYICCERGLGYCDSQHSNEEMFNTCLNNLSVERQAVELIADDMMQEIVAMEEKGLFGHE